MPMTPKEQEYFEFILDTPTSISVICKHFNSTYHASYQIVSRLAAKGYVKKRVGNNSYEWFVPDSLSVIAETFNLLAEERTLEEILLIIQAPDESAVYFAPLLSKTAFAVGYLIKQNLMKIHDRDSYIRTNFDDLAEAQIQATSKVLKQVAHLLDKIQRVGPEQLVLMLGYFHPGYIETIANYHITHHKTPIEVPKLSKLKAMLNEKYGDVVTHDQVEIESLD